MVAARLLLGAAFLYAGSAKLGDPHLFAAQVAAYDVLPPTLVALVALVLPELEVLAGACLVAGFLTESSALVLGLLSLLFAGVMGSALARGLAIDCGCWPNPAAVSWGHVAADLGLAALAGLVLWRGPGRWALDARIR